MSSTSLTLHVQGMHCKACTLLTESEALELPYVTGATANLRDHTIMLTGEMDARAPQEIAAELTRRLHPHGYTVTIEKRHRSVAWGDFAYAIPVALVCAAGFILLQKLGIVNLINPSGPSYGTAFVVGIVASLSTCMAVVGGLVLSISATFAKEGDRVRPQVLFHAGRLAGFFLLGGVIGAAGSAFTLSTSTTFALMFLVGVVMFVLGVNLLDVFHWTGRLQLSLPASLSRHTHKLMQVNHTLTPGVVGVATFFLPCGFTQAMQLYTLSTGSFFAGALTMSAFALGTLPVLGLLSFSSFSIQRSAWSGVFFKSAGLIVILFALYNILNALVVVGLIQPIFSF